MSKTSAKKKKAKVRFTLEMPSALLAFVDAKADMELTSASDIVRRLIREDMERASQPIRHLGVFVGSISAAEDAGKEAK